MNKLLIFLDELYHKQEDQYTSSFAAGSFFKDINCVEKTFLIPVSSETPKDQKYSTTIKCKESSVIELPEWTSTIDYLKKSLKSSEIRKEIKEKIRKAVQATDLVWVRTPSLFGLRLLEEAIKQNKKIIVHHAGDIENAWKNSKYSGSQKLLAYVLSKYMHKSILKKAANPLTYHLCTGSKLENDFLPVNKNTQFFIDSMIDSGEMSQHEYKKAKKSFVYLGKLTEEKGILDLMVIFEELGQKYENIELKIMGFGEEDTKVKEVIQSSKNPSVYEFLGQIPNNEVAQHLKTSDFLILPSKAPTEGFPRVIMEAWAQGLIVIANNVGGVEGLGQHGKNILFSNIGDLVKLKQHIVEIIVNKTDIDAMKKYILQNREQITYQYQKEIAAKLIDGL